MVFSSGLCVLWNQQQGCSLQEQINDAGTSVCVKISGKLLVYNKKKLLCLLIYLQVCVPLYAYWYSSACAFSIACADGSIRGFQYDLVNKGWKRSKTFRCNGNLFLNIETITATYFLLIQGCLKVSRV